MIREAPVHKIDKKAMKVWRLHGLIWTMILLLISVALLIVSIRFDWMMLFSIIAFSLSALVGLLSIVLIPSIRWRRWRYEIFEEEIYIQHGIIIIKRTIIPMSRVQHVDTEMGPFLRLFKLATVDVSTAATMHKIPALPIIEAESLRDQLAVLARVDEDE